MRFSIRLSLSVFSCYYKPHLANADDVPKVRACLVTNSYVSTDAHTFTNPGGVWIPDNVI